jgi:hypothetical protein
MRCKIVRTQKLLWRNIMRSTKSQKALVLYYSIYIYIYIYIFILVYKLNFLELLEFDPS